MARFSNLELFVVRNNIDINFVINHILKISSDYSHRFCCPKCGYSEQTNTDPRTNLARCFICNKNFNNIDMVIFAKNISFVESVLLLQKYLNDESAKRSTNITIQCCEYSTKNATPDQPIRRTEPRHISEFVNTYVRQDNPDTPQNPKNNGEVRRIEMQKIRAILAGRKSNMVKGKPAISKQIHKR